MLVELLKPTKSFLQKIRAFAIKYNAVYIADSVQDGYGRSGHFFAHDYAGVSADIYTMAKGMGNGFPIGGILIAPQIPGKTWNARNNLWWKSSGMCSCFGRT